MNWKLGTLPKWLQASATNGTISPNSAIAVTLSVSTNANSLGIGNYTALVVFTNLAAPTPAKAVQGVAVTLQVVPGLVISSTNAFAIVEPASDANTRLRRTYAG